MNRLWSSFSGLLVPCGVKGSKFNMCIKNSDVWSETSGLASDGRGSK
jgi:hypothetical protein